MVQRALEATPLTLHATAQEAFLEGSARQQCVSHLVKMAAYALGLAGVFAEMYPIMFHARQVSMYVCQLHSLLSLTNVFPTPLLSSFTYCTHSEFIPVVHVTLWCSLSWRWLLHV